MNKKNTEVLFSVSPEIEQAVSDGQRLITYIARNGDSELDPEVTKIIIDAKYKVSNGTWTTEDENTFLSNYDKLAKMVYPVTIESINSIIPRENGIRKNKTKAEMSVAWYRRYTMLALVVLLVIQIYWLFGNDLRLNLHNIMEQKENTVSELTEIRSNEGDESVLNMKLELLNQKLDANFNLLLLWNKVWSLGGGFGGDSISYNSAGFNLENSVENLMYRNNVALTHGFEAGREYHKANMLYFENLLSADFVLKAFQAYILPLLYGLLGAFIFVLRTLLKEIKSITYTFDSEIRFRLRLTLGSLGGMIIGWFLKPEDASSLASLSPMALAFLMGYNVDVLFSIMDRLVDNIKGVIEKPAGKKSSDKVKLE